MTLKKLMAEYEAINNEIEADIEEANLFVESIEARMDEANIFAMLWSIALFADELQDMAILMDDDDSLCVLNILGQLPFTPEQMICAANMLSEMDDMEGDEDEY